MPLISIHIQRFKSLKKCDISVANLNLLIGANGSGKTNILEAICYFYSNLIYDNFVRNDIFDQNNKFSNEIIISMKYNLKHLYVIAKAQVEANEDASLGNNSKRYLGYYKKVISLYNSSSNGVISVEMRQIKGQKISWNYDYKDRFVFRSLFPLFHVNTRNLDIIEWENLWDTIGDLNKLSNDGRQELESEFKKAFNNKEALKKMQGIEKIFINSGIKIKRASSSKFAKSFTQLYFEGDKFERKDKDLSYFSVGTNSVNYIVLLTKTIVQIAKTKMKEPLYILDEPELNLHHTFIDELANELIYGSLLMNVIIATHSARLTKHIIKSNAKLNLYNLKNQDGYSIINKMKPFPIYSPNSRSRATDEHANSYFSKCILFVEGESELELFANQYLLLLFPKLRYLDIYKANSDNKIRDIMLPLKTKARTPYIILIDMDKAIDYSLKKGCFEIKEYLKSYTSLSKEKYLLINDHRNQYPNVFAMHKRIIGMSEKCKFHIDNYKLFSCTDENYYELIDLVKMYLLNYHVFACITTIEGALINSKTERITLKYIKSKKPEAAFKNFVQFYRTYSKNDRINILRLVFEGKTDLLQKLNRTNIDGNEKNAINSMLINKANGWITDYLSTYFNNLKINDKAIGNLSAFAKRVEKADELKMIINQFISDFPELSGLIKLACDSINDNG